MTTLPLRAFTLLALAAMTGGQTLERLDVSTGGALGNAGSVDVRLSDDGRFAALESLAGNFFAGDDLATYDIFLRDRVLGTTVNLTAGGLQSSDPQISSDGRWVAFRARSSGSITGRAFLHDRLNGTTVQIAPALADATPGPITPDGRYIVIIGRNGPVGGSTPFVAYRLDLSNGTLTLASRDLQGNPAPIWMTDPQNPPERFRGRTDLSADGDRIAFESWAPDLVPGDTNGTADVFVFEVSTGTTIRASLDENGVQGDSASFGPSLSSDGAIIAFQSNASNLVPGDANGVTDVFVRDMAQGTTQRASLGIDNFELNGACLDAVLADDGGHVLFDSLASNLPPGDLGFTIDVYVRDLANERTSAVTSGGNVAGNDSHLGSISSDGRRIGFTTSWSPLPSAANGVVGAYLADFGPPCGASGYCTALANSTGNPAAIGSQGELSFALDNFVLACTDLPRTSVGMFFSGTIAIDPGVPFGNGLRCIGGTLSRHRVLSIVDGVAIDWQSLTFGEYAAVRPGDVLHFQLLYRDNAAGGARFNTSDALTVAVCQ